MAQEIEVTVEEGGAIHVEMNGYQGEGCSADYQKFLRLLEEQGVTIVDKKERRKTASETAAVRQSVAN